MRFQIGLAASPPMTRIPHYPWAHPIAPRTINQYLHAVLLSSPRNRKLSFEQSIISIQTRIPLAICHQQPVSDAPHKTQQRKQLTETLFRIAPAFSFRVNVALGAMLKQNIKAPSVTQRSGFDAP